MLTPAMTASRVSPPAFIISIALAHARAPFSLAITTCRGRDWAELTAAPASMADPVSMARRLQPFSDDISVFSQRQSSHNSFARERPWPYIRAAHLRYRSEEP